jgi:predicted SAM-dependent methyltransferase
MKLHLGCGNIYFNNWINIDLDSSIADIKHDLRNQLPYEENSIDFIYNEHFIEHLTAQEGLHLLCECYRVLKPNGVLRVATFDLDDLIKYLQPGSTDWRTYVDPLNTFSAVQTRAEYFNLTFYSWGHKYLYNTEEMIRRFKDSGFTKLQECTIYQSLHSDLINLESRINSTVIIEGTK